MSLEIEGRFTIRPLSWTRALLSDARRIDDDLVILSLSSETTAEGKEWAPFEAEAFHRCSYMTEHLRQGDTISFTEERLSAGLENLPAVLTIPAGGLLQSFRCHASGSGQ